MSFEPPSDFPAEFPPPVTFTADDGTRYTVAQKGKDIEIHEKAKKKNASDFIIHFDGKTPSFTAANILEKPDEAKLSAVVILASLQKDAPPSLKDAGQNLVDAAIDDRDDNPPENAFPSPDAPLSFEHIHPEYGDTLEEPPTGLNKLEFAFRQLEGDAQGTKRHLRALKNRSTITVSDDGREVTLDEKADSSNPLDPLPAQLVVLRLSDQGPLCESQTIYHKPGEGDLITPHIQREFTRLHNGAIQMDEFVDDVPQPPLTETQESHENSIKMELAVILSNASTRGISQNVTPTPALALAASHIRNYLAGEDKGEFAKTLADYVKDLNPEPGHIKRSAPSSSSANQRRIR